MCDALTNIVIPDSITSISNRMLKSCKLLENITIPDSVTSIGDSAFSLCVSLKNISIPKSVQSIGKSAFSDCVLLEEISIPEGVETISAGTFYDCKALKSIEIPESLTTIEFNAFFGCSSLTEILIPESVSSIGEYAFGGCSSLTEMLLPESVTFIDKYAFWGCSSLTEILIPDAVTSIGDSAFLDCISLTEILIPESVTFIGEDAFKNCTNLKIHSYAYSVAAQYAKQNNIDFEAMYKVIINYNVEGITISTVEWAEMTLTGMFFYIDEGACVDIVIEENDGCGIVAIFVNDIKQDLPLIDNTLSIFDINEDVEITINSESIRSQINFIGDGENQKFTIGTDKTLMFILDNDRGYGRVFIDDVELSQNNGDYTWEFVEGTYPIIKLSEAYMNSLKPGKYAIKIEVEDFGVAETIFTVVEQEKETDKIVNENSTSDSVSNSTNNPQTGDNILLFVGIWGISIIGILVATKFRKNYDK